VHPGDHGYLFGTTMTELPGLQSRVPPSLLFVQAAEEQIHLAVEFLVGMVFCLLTVRTLALMDGSFGHASPLLRHDTLEHYTRKCEIDPGQRLRPAIRMRPP